MRLSDYQRLVSIGVPQDILRNLVVLPLSPAVLPSPPASQFPAAPFPLSAVPSPSAEPPRDTSFAHLAPAFSLRLWLALREANRQGLNIALFDGLRTPQRQSWLYAQGRTRTGSRVTNASTVFTSWHGYGMSGDCVFLNSRGQWNWPAVNDTRKLWQKWLEIAQRFGLTTGLNWSFVDAPHTQPNYLTDSPAAQDKLVLQRGGLYGIWKAKDQLSVSESLLQLVA